MEQVRATVTYIHHSVNDASEVLGQGSATLPFGLAGIVLILTDHSV
jgi:hypothetical protein